MSFFPHPIHFFPGIGLKSDDLVAGQTVQLDGAVVRKLIEMALASTEIDEDQYRRSADLQKAFDDGEIKSLVGHYTSTGFFERRFTPSADFDSTWYLQSYPDVRLAVESGEIDNAKQHYLETGWSEWRSPSAAAIEQVRTWRRLLK